MKKEVASMHWEKFEAELVIFNFFFFEFWFVLCKFFKLYKTVKEYSWIKWWNRLSDRLISWLLLIPQRKCSTKFQTITLYVPSLVTKNTFFFQKTKFFNYLATFFKLRKFSLRRDKFFNIFLVIWATWPYFKQERRLLGYYFLGILDKPCEYCSDLFF